MPVEVHSKASRFLLGTVAVPGTPVDISGYVDSVELPQEFDESEVSAFGDDVKQYVLGLSDSAIAFSGNWDPTIHAQLSALNFFDTPVNWEYHPAGTATNQTKYSGTGRIFSYSSGRPITGKQTFTATLQQAGNITRALN